MSTFLVHLDIGGEPRGIWAESGDSYYPEPFELEASANRITATQRDGEPWAEFTDRIASRVSHRDWWQVHESQSTDLEKVWQEVDPSSAPLF